MSARHHAGAATGGTGPGADRGGWLRLLLAVSRPAAGRLGAAALLGAGAAATAVGLMACSAWLISRAALQPPVLHLMVAIVAVRAFGIGRGVLRYLERLTGHDAALRVLTELRVRAYRRLAELAPAGLGRHRRGDLTERLAGDVEAVVDVLVRVVLPYAAALLVGVGSVALVGTLLPPAGVALGVGLLVLAVGVPALQARSARRADGGLAPLRGELATGVVDLLHGLPDLVAYGAAERRLGRVVDTDRRLREATERSAATAGLGSAAVVLVTGACVLVGLVAGAVAVRAGALSGELLAVVTLTPLAVFETVGGLPAAAQRLAAARAALGRIADLVAAPTPAPDPVSPRPVPPGPYTLRLVDVTAGWAADRVALRHVDLTLAPGRRVALVGPSGAGKSTVAALLVRFLDPLAGRVTLNGVDLRDLRGADLRRIVGYLGEDAYLFDTTIAGNLRVARPDATDAELEAALSAARLLDWVRSLPDGLATPVGEHGLALSGGQRRRLALARLLLGDFPVVILDEPTEHLDEPTARALTADLLAATSGRTTLLITHRLDDLAGVDEVVRLPARDARPVPTPRPRRVAGRAAC
jgi:thiol reductant ABC exporter CydC subunit